jgi:hypothetical protein
VEFGSVYIYIHIFVYDIQVIISFHFTLHYLPSTTLLQTMPFHDTAIPQENILVKSSPHSTDPTPLASAHAIFQLHLHTNPLQNVEWIISLYLSRQFINSKATGTLAEWLTRCPAKAIPSGACVRITQVSLTFLLLHHLCTCSRCIAASPVNDSLVAMVSFLGACLCLFTFWVLESEITMSTVFRGFVECGI